MWFQPTSGAFNVLAVGACPMAQYNRFPEPSMPITDAPLGFERGRAIISINFWTFTPL